MLEVGMRTRPRSPPELTKGTAPATTLSFLSRREEMYFATKNDFIVPIKMRTFFLPL